MGEDTEISIRRKVVYDFFDKARQSYDVDIDHLLTIALDFHNHSTRWHLLDNVLTKQQIAKHVVLGTELSNLQPLVLFRVSCRYNSRRLDMSTHSPQNL